MNAFRMFISDPWHLNFTPFPNTQETKFAFENQFTLGWGEF